MNRTTNSATAVRAFAIVFAAASNLLALREVSAQAITPDFNKLVAHRDSFVIMYQGNALGASIISIDKSAKGWVIKENTNLAGGMFAQTTTLETDAKLNPISLTQNGSMQGQSLVTEIAFTGGRAKGKAMSAAQGGPTSIEVDADVPNGTIDSDAVQFLLPAFPWAQGATATVNSFTAGKGQILVATFTVVGSESIKLPSGTAVDAWKIEQKGGEGEATFFIAKDATHRLLKIAPNGQPIELILAN